MFKKQIALLLFFSFLVQAVGGGGGGGAPVLPPEPGSQITEFVNINVNVTYANGAPLSNALVTANSNTTYSAITSFNTSASGTGSFTIGRYKGVYLVIRSPNVTQFVYPAFNASQNLTLDIQAPDKPVPKFIFSGTELKCGEQETLADRIKCRLALLQPEAKLYYVPEECRIKTNGEQQSCFYWYELFQNCRAFTIGQQRDACAKEKIELGEVQNELLQCSASNNQTMCRNLVRDKVYLFGKFKLYDLQDKTEKS